MWKRQMLWKDEKKCGYILLIYCVICLMNEMNQTNNAEILLF